MQVPAGFGLHRLHVAGLQLVPSLSVSLREGILLRKRVDQLLPLWRVRVRGLVRRETIHE